MHKKNDIQSFQPEKLGGYAEKNKSTNIGNYVGDKMETAANRNSILNVNGYFNQQLKKSVVLFQWTLSYFQSKEIIDVTG